MCMYGDAYVGRLRARLAELQASYDEATVNRRELNNMIHKLGRLLTEQTERAEAAETELARHF